jgi:tetraacyldisaccharide 4'-kinase
MEIPQVSGPVAAFCGIARPKQFFTGLEQGGVSLTARKAYPDHHHFSAADLHVLEWMADRSGATALLTTEKDRIRIGSMVPELGQVPLLTADLRIVLENEAEVINWLGNALVSGSANSTL